MTNLQTASASAHRIFDFLESEELGDESDKTEKLDAVRGAVTFDHVRFSYPDSPDKIIIKISPLRSIRARRSPSSAPPVPVRPPWSSCSCGSMMWIPAKFAERPQRKGL